MHFHYSGICFSFIQKQCGSKQKHFTLRKIQLSFQLHLLLVSLNAFAQLDFTIALYILNVFIFRSDVLCLLIIARQIMIFYNIRILKKVDGSLLPPCRESLNRTNQLIKICTAGSWRFLHKLLNYQTIPTIVNPRDLWLGKMFT